jgi:Gluconate 2-dehydrogenase subunit 3
MAANSDPGDSDVEADPTASRAESSGTDLSRRELIKLGAAATLGASITIDDAVTAQPPASAGVPATAGPAFFTAEEFAVVDELSEMIIPTDDHSPGARAARVAAHIDARLAEAWEEKERSDWREGVRLVEQLSHDISGKPFMQSSADERLAILTRMAENEGHPQAPEQMFFAKLKFRAVQAYYTSEIGIRQEMDYKGNNYLAEFVGFDVS